MADWRPSLIPRKTLNARRITLTYDNYNIPSEIEAYFPVENAGVQPYTGGKGMKASLEGYRNKNAYYLFTTTPLRTADEGDRNAMADRVEIDGKWCTVLKVAKWDTGIRSHYEAILVETNEHKT